MTLGQSTADYSRTTKSSIEPAMLREGASAQKRLGSRCYYGSIAAFRRPVKSEFWFEGRRFTVDRGVFDPIEHLSGLAFAEHLRTLDFSGQWVLEVGTGCGLLAFAAFSRGGRVVATDIDLRAAECASRNLAGTGIDVRLGDFLDPVRGELFDTLIINPPYEIGRARRPTLRSPDLLRRLATEWPNVAKELLVAFPTDSIDVLRDIGVDAPLVGRIQTQARELGVFQHGPYESGSSDST